MFRPKFLAFPGKVWEEYVIESDVFSNIQPDLSSQGPTYKKQNIRVPSAVIAVIKAALLKIGTFT